MKIFFSSKSFPAGILWLPLLLIWGLTSCRAQEVTETDFYQMLADLYKQTVPLIKSAEVKKDYLILDTREQAEYNVSHLPGAVWVGYDHFQQEKLKDIPKDQPILVYCSVGYRSERIGERLQEMGFSRVYNLYGGIFDWVNQKNPVLDKNEASTQRVHTYNKRWSKWLFEGEKVW